MVGACHGGKKMDTIKKSSEQAPFLERPIVRTISSFQWSGHADDADTASAADPWCDLPDRSSNLQRQKDWYDR